MQKTRLSYVRVVNSLIKAGNFRSVIPRIIRDRVKKGWLPAEYLEFLSEDLKKNRKNSKSTYVLKCKWAYCKTCSRRMKKK